MCSLELLASHKVLLYLSVGQAGVVGQPRPRGRGPALRVHNGLGACRGLPSVGRVWRVVFPCTGWAWLAFWTATHSVCTGDPGTWQRQMHLWVTKGCSHLCPSSSTITLWLHSVASCDCQIQLLQPYVQTGRAPVLFIRRRRTEFVPWTHERAEGEG